MSEEIVKALEARAWYPLAALLLMAFIQFWRKAPLASELWERIPDGARWLPAVVLSAATGFTDAFSAGADWKVAVAEAVGAVLWMGLPAMGAAALLKESPLPWDGGAGGHPERPSVPPTLTLLVLAYVASFGLSACTQAKPVARTLNDVARELCAVYRAEEHGTSVEVAATRFCATHGALDPFVIELLRVRQALQEQEQEQEQDQEQTGGDS